MGLGGGSKIMNASLVIESEVPGIHLDGSI